jgi:hypothetical protein
LLFHFIRQSAVKIVCIKASPVEAHSYVEDSQSYVGEGKGPCISFRNGSLFLGIYVLNISTSVVGKACHTHPA